MSEPPVRLELSQRPPEDESSAPVRNVHPARVFFAARLHDLLASDSEVRNPTHLAALLKQHAPAGMLGLSQTQVHRYYNGQTAPTVAVIYEIAKVLGVTPASFVPRIRGAIGDAGRSAGEFVDSDVAGVDVGA